MPRCLQRALQGQITLPKGALHGEYVKMLLAGPHGVGATNRAIHEAHVLALMSGAAACINTSSLAIRWGPTRMRHLFSVGGRLDGSGESMGATSTLLRRISSSHRRRGCAQEGDCFGGPRLFWASPRLALSSSSCATLTMQRRWSSSGRRPTYHEIAEALSVLNADIDTDASALKKRYRELVKANHPDTGGDEKAMASITVAYERLVSITRREREAYKQQQRTLRGGSYYNPTYRGGASGYRTSATGYGPSTAQGFDEFVRQQAHHSHHAQQTGFDATRARQQQAFWSYYTRASDQYPHGSFTDSPFASRSPFSLRTYLNQARFLPSSALIARALLAYLVLSMLFLYLFRRYRDWNHDDGWRMAESLARHERLAEMQRLRQEMKERAQMLGEAAGRDDGLTGGSMWADYNLRPMHQGESPEARALEYARRRRIEMMEVQQQALRDLPEMRGWPTVAEEKGRIIKRAQDPPGIVYFEPPKADTLARQVANQRRGMDVAARGGTTAPRAAPSDSTSHETPVLPPESNVGSVVAATINTNDDARAVMHEIFAALRQSQEVPRTTK